ncbi:hypothetical protein LEMLEM_LOCUS3381, partial [Lemmus lemmus]
GRTADCYSETQLCKSVSVRPCFCSPSAAEENSHRYRTLRPQVFFNDAPSSFTSLAV